MRIRARQAAKGSARDGDAGGRTYEWTGRTGRVARLWRDGLGKELCPQRRGGLHAQMRRRWTSGESVRRAERELRKGRRASGRVCETAMSTSSWPVQGESR